MKNVMESMKKDFGSVGFDGKEYILIQDAYIDGTVYVADAIKADDEPDEDGYVPLYKIEWEIIYPEMEDEGDRCDWDNPADVGKAGAKFNLNDGSVF